jgi:hypothetical protein
MKFSKVIESKIYKSSEKNGGVSLDLFVICIRLGCGPRHQGYTLQYCQLLTLGLGMILPGESHKIWVNWVLHCAFLFGINLGWWDTTNQWPKSFHCSLKPQGLPAWLPTSGRNGFIQSPNHHGANVELSIFGVCDFGSSPCPPKKICNSQVSGRVAGILSELYHMDVNSQ